MPLYGHDMTDAHTPLEARMGWAVDFEKEAFVGREALLQQKAQGVKHKLIGFEMIAPVAFSPLNSFILPGATRQSMTSTMRTVGR